MTQVDGKTSVTKTNLYRARRRHSPPINPRTDTGLAYCTNIATIAPARLQFGRRFTEAAASPDPAAANLFDFLTQRLTATWTNLGCQDLTHQGPPTVGGAPNAAAATTTAATTTAATTTAATTTNARTTTPPTK